MGIKTQTFLVLTVVLCFLCNRINAIVCNEICKNAQCENITSCPPGQTLKPGGYCNCCMKCVTILKHNEKCTGPNILMGVPPSSEECGDGLTCINGVCKPFPNLIIRF